MQFFLKDRSHDFLAFAYEVRGVIGGKNGRDRFFKKSPLRPCRPALGPARNVSHTIPGRVPPKVLENGSKDLSSFLHEVRDQKISSVARPDFRKKNPFRLFFEFLGSKYPKIKVFATLRENGSNDFAHFAYLDRSHQYLQLLY